MSGSFRFAKAWGAELYPDGSARFRLWAPKLRALRLRLGQDKEVAMRRGEDGWFACRLSGLGPGTDYAFVLPDGAALPDPAARAQAGDVHGASRLIDPESYAWRMPSWRGRPWEEAVIYELHVGTFTPEHTFAGVEGRLDHLAALGVTAIELMPVAQFAGARGWGYDGVLPYCPHPAYGGVDGLKRLVDAAHERGLMVILDVVYNHLGPEGNHISRYAPEFFDPGRDTPWGKGIRFEAPAVRRFFIDNALYWIEEYRIDGLRLDAIDQIVDSSAVAVLEELAAAVRASVRDRHVHLATEDERNIVRLHPHEAGRPRLYTAEWNDDLHHALHALATGESEGYYHDFAGDPAALAARALAEGFAFQGEPYTPWNGRPRGVPSANQPPVAFIDFLQNHDQIGNRAFGERLTVLTDGRALEVLCAVLLLNPQIPLLFMGEEWGETRPFLFFTDFHGQLADAVREGRRREFAAFAAFADAGSLGRIPDPNAQSTFEACCLDWSALEQPAGRARLELMRVLLAARRAHIIPWLAATRHIAGRGRALGPHAFDLEWRLGAGRRLRMAANLGSAPVAIEPPANGATVIHEVPAGIWGVCRAGRLPERSMTALACHD